MYTVIKQIDHYNERLEPAWEYPNPDDQWLHAETITEYVGTTYNVLYVYDDGKYDVCIDLESVPDSAWENARTDLDYDKVLDSLLPPWRRFLRRILPK